MVDAVLYFEGDASHTFRILRGVKNRYGATDEIGVFEMSQGGLREVANPSALFLDQRDEGAAGSAVFAGMEGTRPVLCEIQALVAPSPLGTPRRAVVGWDSSRLSMVLAVLETRCGVRIGANDIYLNVAGGLKINEPAADLAVAAALISSLTGAPLPNDAVYFGEISLAGGVRPVAHASLRIARPPSSASPAPARRDFPREKAQTVSKSTSSRLLWNWSAASQRVRTRHKGMNGQILSTPLHMPANSG